MATPYRCLEEIAADVAPHVPGEGEIVHIEVDFDRHPFEVTFMVTPYDRERLYDLSLRTPLVIPPDVALRVRQVLSDYITLTRPLLEQELVLLRVSVTSDGSFFIGQSCRRRPGHANDGEPRNA